ncbi:MAG: beta-ketoacyl-ACP reductase [bacterium]|nr:MAG: beta-ketoacyl-ACP reductase [bacterium]
MSHARTVLITGSTSDIGREGAIRFARAGWHVLAHYNSSFDKAKELRELILKANSQCDLFQGNLMIESDLHKLINDLKPYAIDSLVNNAGAYITSKHFSELELKEIMDTFILNTFSPMLISSKLFEGMKKRKFGRIVNISSIAAKYGGSSHSMHYGASKRALEGLTKTLAKEGAEHNVLVNTIRPGVIDTDFHKRFPKDMMKRMNMIPMKKMGSANDIAGMIYYLGSDQNKFITNEMVTISGGE